MDEARTAVITRRRNIELNNEAKKDEEDDDPEVEFQRISYEIKQEREST